MWLRYLDARKSASARKRYLLFERAVAALPGSYKVGCRRQQAGGHWLLDEFSSRLLDAAADWATRPLALPPAAVARLPERAAGGGAGPGPQPPLCRGAEQLL